MKEFIIGKNDAGQRLDRFVSKSVPLLPASLAQKYIRLKRIKVGGKPVKRDYRLIAGDVVAMYIGDEFLKPASGKETFNEKPFTGETVVACPPLDLLYEDENILLVNKEPGVLCHSDSDYDYRSLISRIHFYLRKKGEWQPQNENSFTPALCNRIDRNTSGIVIAAKNAEALRVINEKIKLREIDKHYLAIVHGIPVKQSGRLEAWLFKDAVKNQVYVLDKPRPGAKTAVMEYETVASGGRLSLLECRLITGRTHQIRAQLAGLGHPLLGDGKYGSERLNKPFGEKHQALCSYKLEFNFTSDAGPLSYLRCKEFVIHDVPFVKKYFPSVDIQRR